MYIKLTNGVPENYSIGQLRRDNPQVSFPKSLPDSTLTSFNVFPVKPADQPTHDLLTQNMTEGVPVMQSGEWVQVWTITEATAEEIAQRQAEHTEQVRQQRANAYREESDPLFFKAQRGEASQQEWLDKVAEIKARFPAVD